MKKMLFLIVAAVFPLVAQASTFNFSYTFHDGQQVTGSMTGTRTGSYVNDVSNVKVKLGGIEIFDGSNVFGFSATNTGDIGGAPIVSFNGALNNFFFMDSASNFPGTRTFAKLFDFVNMPTSQVAMVSVPPNIEVLDWNCTGCGSEYALDASRWHLVEQPSTVPLPAALPLMMSGLGLLGFAVRRTSNA